MIARDKVRYVGEPIAVVVAETQALAEDALEAIAVDIAPLPAVPDRHAAAERQVAAVRNQRQQPRGAILGIASAMPTRLSSGPSTPAGRAFAVTA